MAETFVRSIACAALSGQLQEIRTDLHDQLVALLVLVADARREMAQDLAAFLLSLFAHTIDTASPKLGRADRALFVSIHSYTVAVAFGIAVF